MDSQVVSVPNVIEETPALPQGYVEVERKAEPGIQGFRRWYLNRNLRRSHVLWVKTPQAGRIRQGITPKSQFTAPDGQPLTRFESVFPGVDYRDVSVKDGDVMYEGSNLSVFGKADGGWAPGYVTPFGTVIRPLGTPTLSLNDAFQLGIAAQDQAAKEKPVYYHIDGRDIAQPFKWDKVQAKVVSDRIDQVGFNQHLLDRFNQFRAAHGRNPLRLSEELTQGARVRTQELAAANTTRPGGRPHGRPNGDSYHSAYPVENQRWVGEIAAARGWSGNTAQLASSQWLADTFFKQWVDSPAHRANILDPYIHEMGGSVSLSESLWRNGDPSEGPTTHNGLLSVVGLN